jgi:hypothetical protein
VRNFLVAVASHWAGNEVACRFNALADNTPLATDDDTQPFYEIPNGTSEIKLTVTPTVSDYWETNVTLSVSSSGVISVKDNSSAFVRLRTAVANASRGTVVLVKVSRFKDVTTAATATPNVLDQLKNPPVRRRKKISGTWVMQNVNEVANHEKAYGVWPPGDWKLQPVPDAHFLDANTPLSNAGTKAGTLNFAKAPSLNIDVDNIVLRIAGRKAPELFNVTWPKAIAPQENADPTRFLVYCRQTNQGNKYDEIGLFVGGDLDKQPYPFNFDYADSGLFESLHYGSAPPGSGSLSDPFSGPFFWSGAKGVPYQVAKSGAQLVTVMPCGKFGPEYGVLKDTEQMAKTLQEIQAFMFWRAGIANPPTAIGNTALASFSSANREVRKWLENETNLKGNFLLNTLKAVYFLDPPADVVGKCIAAALKWAEKAGDARIRLYSQYRMDEQKKLLGLKPADELPVAPYIASALQNKRTATALPINTWSATFEGLFGGPRKPAFVWDDIHHIIPATMLTHALAQGDF